MSVKYFLQFHLFVEIIGKVLIYYYVDMIITNILAYATVQYNKTCITHKLSESTENFGNKLLLSISTELCHKHIILGSQNGPLKNDNYI